MKLRLFPHVWVRARVGGRNIKYENRDLDARDLMEFNLEVPSFYISCRNISAITHIIIVWDAFDKRLEVG